MKKKKSDPSEIINIPDLRHFAVPSRITARPNTPGWTDRSRNGEGFYCTQQPKVEKIDWDGSGGRRYRRN